MSWLPYQERFENNYLRNNPNEIQKNLDGSYCIHSIQEAYLGYLHMALAYERKDGRKRNEQK